MSTDSRRYIFKEASINGVINGCVNGAFAWYLSEEKPVLSVWTAQGVLVDFIATAVILVFILSLIVLPLQRRKVAKEGLAAVQPPFAFMRYMGWLAPQRDVVKALALALLAGLLSLPVLATLFSVAGVDQISRFDFTLLKSVYTGVVAAAVVPLIVLFAMHPVRRAQAS